MDVTSTETGGEAGDASLELSPRTSAPSGLAARRRRNRRWGAVGLLVVLAGVIGLLATQLDSSTTYFYTVDQAVAKRADTGSRTFRLEGTVVDVPVKRSTPAGEQLTFTLASKGVTAACTYSGGEPSALFRKGEPVVLQGHWEGDVFTSSLIMVKHDATYEAKHPNRVTTTTAVGLQ